jgi:peptidyl-prolyl cis-trans isomerase D
MMRQMREATKPIMVLAAFAFLALMVFRWGMDITGRSGRGSPDVGQVNGDPISYDAYMSAYRQLYEQAQQSQEEMIASQQNKELEDRAFDQMVTQLLVGQELRRRGITVTNQEISEAAQFSPPDYVRPQFQDSTGNFNLAAYQSFLATLPQDQLVILEAYYRDVIPRTKLLRQLGAGIYIPDAELWQAWKDANQLAQIRYVPMDPATRYEDSDFSVPASEIQAYYRAHQDEFSVPAHATVKFVVLPKTPNAADTVASRERADSLRQLLHDGADFAELAKANSSDQATAASGGDLGVFPKGRQVGPVDSAIFSSRVGLIDRTVKSPFGFHIIDVTERWGADSARARHILIPVKQTDESEITLLTRADSLEELASSTTLDGAAEALGLRTQTADITHAFPFIAGAGQISEGADWAFDEAAAGDVSPVFETSTAFYALELVSSQPDGVMELEKATPAIESTLIFDLKMQRAREQAQALVDSVRAGKALVNVAAELGLDVRGAGPFARDEFVPGIGRQNAVIGAAFGLPIGQVSGVVSTPTNQYVLEVVDRTNPDSTEWTSQLAQQRTQAVQTVQQQRLQEWLDALRATAKIVDRRQEVLTPVDQNGTQSSTGF